jgi:hypothetical protein
MAEERKLTREEKEMLLKEYELCQVSAQGLESAIWQTSAAIGIGSIGTLALVAGQPLLGWLGLGIPITIGLLAILASWIWWRMARRWWSIQHVKFCRMRHIEERLQFFYQTRYLTYLDDLGDLKIRRSDTEKRQKEVDRLRGRFLPTDLTSDQQGDLDKLSRTHQSKGVQKFLCWLPILNTVAWGLYWICLILSLLWPPQRAS